MSLDIENLTVGYRREPPLLKDVSLHIDPGQIWGLIAPNGAGKTSLMRAIAGDAKPLVCGSLCADGMTPLKPTPYNRFVSYVACDDSALDRSCTARFHLKAASDLWGSRLDPSETARLFELDGFLDKPIRSLSQGMRQQVTIALCYQQDAPYTLLDEPLNALDPLKREMACRNLRDMAHRNCSVFVSSHILSDLNGLCDKVVVFRSGTAVVVPATANMQELFDRCYGGESSRPSTDGNRPPQHMNRKENLQ